jgi:polyisoprenoid-binding protein YceI
MGRGRPAAAVRTLATLLLAACAATAAAAESWVLRLDPAASEVRFQVGATLHTVRGSFALEPGSLRFDPQSGAIAGEVVVDARSGETGIERRDRAMHGDILASDAHPRIVLRPRRLRDVRRGPDALEATLEAELVLRGEAHAVTIPVHGRREGSRGVVEARLDVPYVAWGLPDPDTFVLKVDDVVELDVRLAGTLEPPAR